MSTPTTAMRSLLATDYWLLSTHCLKARDLRSVEERLICESRFGTNPGKQYVQSVLRGYDGARRLRRTRPLAASASKSSGARPTVLRAGGADGRDGDPARGEARAWEVQALAAQGSL